MSAESCLFEFSSASRCITAFSVAHPVREETFDSSFQSPMNSLLHLSLKDYMYSIYKKRHYSYASLWLLSLFLKVWVMIKTIKNIRSLETLMGCHGDTNIINIKPLLSTEDYLSASLHNCMCHFRGFILQLLSDPPLQLMFDCCHWLLVKRHFSCLRPHVIWWFRRFHFLFFT